MLGSLRTSVARAGRTASQQVRRMATDAIAEVEKEAAHAQKEANKWKMISFGCIPVCVGLGALTLSNAHTHHRHAPNYPYMLYKVKDFPWGPDPLFGYK
ncbi:hypothetical protein CHLNCDRAFT_142490 [Chlorella variabilis]|uniref:Cytochrome c oxidase subunit 6a n=1 Tax=Chlorella variabilis TaxID=554065 RepID=E1ZTR8_CHLVA|nr:hypothetical protein CHLNCDRAFT_142490 [Chlorella variabilis]EFN50762.1 hypothetical protein CHLNCDRAFT_142490 [Chlorella variabilis]|eukprot:XP_005842874.1 hypothetical protein CHLNCDRAFT_142490 [Chlorella variabilis]